MENFKILRFFNLNNIDYFDHPFNTTIKNERQIEIPVALRFIESKHPNKIIEIGSVLHHYFDLNHVSIDPTDKHATLNDYAENINFKNKSVLSISTLEHIGRGDYGLPKNKTLSSSVLNKIYNDSSSCLISWPIGFNIYLDEYVKENSFDYVFHRRKTDTEWELSFDENNFNASYNKPYHAGNSVIWIYKNL